MAVQPRGGPRVWVNPASLGIIIAAYLLLVCGFTYWRVEYVPPVLPQSPPHLFSELRARQHVVQLASVIRDRQVSSPGLALATRYMRAELDKLQQLASSRTDLDVEVALETVSGAAAMSFTHINFTNAYRALDNLVLAVTPRGLEHVPALLVASHYDSAVCSQGPALPCSALSRPQAAHGWYASSRFAARLGAFVNLEAMGGRRACPSPSSTRGPWALAAWARGGPAAQGSRGGAGVVLRYEMDTAMKSCTTTHCAIDMTLNLILSLERYFEDIFDLQLLPADSDFRMFSARHYGRLPGVDVAFLLDSRAYHSYLDSEQRIRPGVMQEMGEALLGGVGSLSVALAQRSRINLSAEQQAVQAQERAVYWDILGYAMVTYSEDLADRLHTVVAVLLLVNPLQALLQGQRREAFRVVLGAARTALSIVLAVVCPASLGALRVMLLGRPMVWFTNQWMGLTMFLPIALVGGLLPWLNIKERAVASAPAGHGTFMAAQVLGAGVTSSAIGTALNWFGLRGNASIFSVCAILCLLTCYLLASGPELPRLSLLLILLLGLVPVALGSSAVIVFVRVIMERMAISGFLHATLADVVVGGLCGAAVLACTAGAFMPLLAYGLAGNRKKWIGRMVIMSVVASVWSSVHLQPYSPFSPKRLIVNHIVHTRPTDPQAPGATLPIQNTDAQPNKRAGWAPQVIMPPSEPMAMQVVRESFALGGIDSTRVSSILNLTGVTPTASGARDFTPVFPLSDMVEGISLPLSAVEHMAPVPVRLSRYTPSLSPSGAPSILSLIPGLAHMLTSPAHNLTSEPAPENSTSPDTAAGSSAGEGGNIIQGVTGTEESPVTPLELLHLPSVQWVSLGEGQRQGRLRLNLRLYSQLPCWGIINITGPGLQAWSFTDHLQPSSVCQHIVRLVTQDSDPFWSFWLEVAAPDSDVAVPGGGAAARRVLGLRLELSISYLHRTPLLDGLMRRMPLEATESWLATVYQSVYKY
ncbi:hypothetical protein QJQ45_018697 [Haematococcus lacustris]|nr:hypothetical protein QJQ45_018697 [Haematococcus lacustris]